MMRGRSVNDKTTAKMTKPGSRTTSKPQNHSKSENDSGQPCQNGNEAPTETRSQRHESNAKNRVLGLRTVCRTVQLPVSKLSGYDSMRAVRTPPKSLSNLQNGWDVGDQVGTVILFPALRRGCSVEVSRSESFAVADNFTLKKPFVQHTNRGYIDAVTINVVRPSSKPNQSLLIRASSV